jgi:hypothetical protein
MKTVEFDFASQRDLERSLRDRGWTDGLPVHVPTRDRVDEFITASGMRGDEVIGHVAPQGGLATVGLIAVNAVMAGCEPEHLPVVVAAVRALLKDPFNLHLVQVTTNPVAPLAVVNGPARLSANVRWGREALSPGPGGNGPIGRAIRFVMRNIGGIGDSDTATFGNPAKYSYCMAEDEDANPWEPLHVWQGYRREDSVVTVLGIEAFIDIVPESGSTTAENLLNHFGHALQTISTGVWWSKGNPTLILTPRYAELLANRGMSRRDVQNELFERGKIPVDSLPFPNINTGDWKLDGNRILVTSSPEDIYIIVAGSPEGHHAYYLLPCCLCKATHARV